MKKKVLIVGPGLKIGGVERSLIGLLDAIDYSEYDVDLFLENHTGEFMPLINQNVNLLSENRNLMLSNMPIISLIKNGHIHISAIRIINKLIYDTIAKATKTSTLAMDMAKLSIISKMPKFEKQYDIALGFMVPHYIINDKVNAKLKIGWVHTDYTNDTEFPNVKKTIAMWEKLDKIACVSDDVKKSFDKVFPTLKDKTIVVENILSTDFIKSQADEEIDDTQILSDDSFKILSVGRFCFAKGFDDAVIACSRLVKKGYNIKWYFVGYGPDEKLIRDTIKEYNIENNAIVLGKKSNPYPYIKACDLYVQPSRYEGKAVTVREAQILNKPVMITRYETSSVQLKEGFDGYICEMGVDGIVGGIEYLINHPDVIQQLIDGTKLSTYDNSQEIYKFF